MGAARIEALGVRYYGALAESRGVDVLAASAAAGVLRPILSSGVSIVNARGAARERGIDIVESRSTRSRHYTSLVSIKLQTDAGERWAEGTVFEPNSPRLVSVRGVDVEAPLAGTMLIIAQRRSAGRDRRGRDDSRPPRRQHRQLRARPRTTPARSASSTSTRTPSSAATRSTAAVDELRRSPAIREALAGPAAAIASADGLERSAVHRTATRSAPG